MCKSILLLLGLASLANGQTTVITGKISNAITDSVFVTHFDKTELVEVDEGTPLDLNGHFLLRYEKLTETDYYFKHGGEQTHFYAEAGDSVHLTLDYQQFDESLVYTGNQAAFNNYLAAYFLAFLDSDDPGSNLQTAYQVQIQMRDPLPYMEWVDSIELAQQAFLKQWESRLASKLYVLEAGRIEFEIYRYRGDYKYLRQFFASQSDKIQVPEYPENWDSYLDKVPLDRDELVSIDNYVEISIEKIRVLLSKLHPEITYGTESYSLLFLKMTASLCSKVVGEHVAKSWLESVVAQEEVAPYEAAVSQFLNSAAPEELKTDLNQLILSRKGLSVGAAASDFSLMSNTGQQLRLSDLAGKFVYVDFWATWCAPCIAELKYVQKWKSTLTDSSFVFLYISLDEEESTWRQSIEKYLPNGFHVWGKGMNSEVAKAYGIRSLPNYFLIGPAGSFISTNPPRPSSGNLTEYLLGEKAKFESK